MLMAGRCSSRFCVCHPFGASGDHGGTVDGLGDVVVASRVQTLLSVFSHGVCSQGDDGDAIATCAECLSECVAVHLGHLHVGD